MPDFFIGSTKLSFIETDNSSYSSHGNNLENFISIQFFDERKVSEATGEIGSPIAMNDHIKMKDNFTFVLINSVAGTVRTEFQLSSAPSRPKLSTANNWYESGKLQIPFYSIIFTLAMIGNTLVIITLLRNHQMRTITNIFLLNLAVSDLLLGVLCMPFTLIGALLRDFVFGELMCKLLPFLQACSVAVGVWTLVAISVERYYAICHPLRSLRWQTLKHAYKLITAIWIGSFICMFPIALLSQLKPTKQGNHKCRETWQSNTQEKAYNIFLDVILLLLPLLIMLVTYSLISKTLFQAMRNERMQRDYCDGQDIRIRRRKSKKTKTEHRLTSTLPASSCSQVQRLSSTSSSRSRVGSMKTLTLRRTNAEKSLVSKKRVVRMLFVVVLEFFICWAPLYVINTIALFDSSVIYNNLGYTAISFFQLLAYTSSCCNPITYCFMNRSFRKSFLNLFGCLNEYRNEFGTLGSEINMDSRFRSFRNHIYSANSV